MSKAWLQGNAESGSSQPELLPLDTKTNGSANQVSRNRQVEPILEGRLPALARQERVPNRHTGGSLY